MRKSVLLTEVDVFSSTGHGRTVYRALIRGRPDLDFYYLRRREAVGAARPDNARAVPLAQGYGPPSAPLPEVIAHFQPAFRAAMDIARSVAEARTAGGAPADFDIVDAPEDRREGLFIRFALQAHGVGVGRTATALHGETFRGLAAAGRGRAYAAERLGAWLQRQAADVRYALADPLQRREDGGGPPYANSLDPLVVIGPGAPSVSSPQARAPDVVMMASPGRRARVDVLLDALWWAPPGTWRELRLYADAAEEQGGALAAVAGARRLAIRTEPWPSPAASQALWRDKTLLVVAPGGDGLDLEALAALLAGCPALVPRHTELARWIERRLPECADLVCDLAGDGSLALRLHAMAADYDAMRTRLVAAIEHADLKPDLSTLEGAYAEGVGADPRAQRRVQALAEQLLLAGPFLERREPPRGAGDLVLGAASALAALMDGVGPASPSDAPPSNLAGAAARVSAGARRLGERRLASRLSTDAAAELRLLGSHTEAIRRLSVMGERTEREIADKIAELQRLAAERRVDRVRWTAEIARLERRRGRAMFAAAHQLRIMRWLGADRLQALPQVLDDLRAQGRVREAEVAAALYGDPAQAFARSAELLEAQRSRWRNTPERPAEVLDDRRGETQPKVSVIVPVSGGADSLRAFLRMLSAQTLVRDGTAEVVLIASGPPRGERQVVETTWPAGLANIVYAGLGTPERGPAAWNRGVQLARGDYLAVLGLDDGLRPDALDRLARALDEAAEADWAMADTLVTAVDRRGVFLRDLDVLDRSRSRPALRQLDSAYVAHLGGVYRRRLHERFGGYDEDFETAGETEFKARVLPFIRTVRVAERLAVRAVPAGPSPDAALIAEIEALRARDLHRSDAGVEAAFAAASEPDVEAALAACFDYRPSGVAGAQTDLHMAAALARHLKRRSNGAVGGALVQALAAAREDIRQLELWRTPEQGLAAQRRFADLIHRIRDGAGWAAARVGGACAVEVFNDVRYRPL